ncbi:MAG: flagellar FlbD family protein [Clostridiaceae bacterium]|mgnify:CR=1 FL=1|jgi:flagellar protein FlbD|nr:flagellar FlbD family protein [Clostridiaceae bacterium]
MIKLTRLNGTFYVLNSDMIETIEATPDTVITFSETKKYICKESVDEVIDKIIEFRGKILIYAETHK